MLRRNPTTRRAARPKSGCFAIIASRYNRRYVDAMLRAARATLRQGGAASVAIVRVPGAFEIPAVAATLAATGRYDALVCLGVILRGATSHAQHIAEAVTQALAGLQVSHRLPVIHEVLLLESRQQARERCLGARTNRGVEAAQTALEMAGLLAQLRRQLAPAGVLTR